MSERTIPLSVPNLDKDILPRVEETIESGWVSTGGRFIKEFEERVASYVGVPRAVALQSATAGLHLALLALGVDPEDEVIVPTLTFIAAVNPVRYVGAEPVFMDCDDSMNMDTGKLQDFLETHCSLQDGVLRNLATGRRIRGVLVVHVFGNPMDMSPILELARHYGLFVLEDAAEAMGSHTWDAKGQKVFAGTQGDMGVYSFNANKIITCGGGGMVVAKDPALLEKVAYLGLQAKDDALFFRHHQVGYNYRMTNIHAAFGCSQMNCLEDFVERKIRNYAYYSKALEHIPGLTLWPFHRTARANHWFYSLYVDAKEYGRSRDELLHWLNARGVQARPLWALIHEQKPYTTCEAYRIEHAVDFAAHILNIPCSTGITKEEIQAVVVLLEEGVRTGEREMP